MSEIMNYVENRESSEFYPTPAPLVKKMLEKVDWNLVQTVLEPSAGKGDILREIARIIYHRNAREVDVDCIELESSFHSQIQLFRRSKD
ncbi:MAG: hypothetical protein K2K02_10760 [Ruminococcus sp.]|nr:hypothetical protein [Ruminococcus sp.]